MEKIKNDISVNIKSSLNKILLFSMVLFLNQLSIAQNKITEELKNQFEKYQTNNLQEKVFVHVDKSFYLAGETIWFKGYIVDGFLNRPLPLSKVLYVELIDKDLKPVLQTKVAIEDAMSSGSISIPITIASGNYTFRAYTSWMKNYNANFFYEQNVTVVNTMREAPLPNDSNNNAKEIDVQFFPEGGNLVAGLTSKIAFKVTDKYGAGINCSGTILNDKNKAVANFKSLLFGMGNFIFTPLKNEHYKAVVKTNNYTSISENFPAIYNAGYVLNLTEKNKTQIEITVNSVEPDNSLIYLFVQTHHLIKSIQTATLLNGKAVFNIDKNNLAEGITHFTIFNNDKKPVCERLYFKQPTSKLLINTNLLNATYTLRDSVKFDINTTVDSTAQTAADLSMSVFLLDSLQSKKYFDIQSYLLLSSDLKGKIESPDYYLNNLNKDAELAVDNLMLTQGWSRFKWENILQDKTAYFQFLPEYEGLLLNAKITDKTTRLPIKNATQYISFPNKSFQFFNATSRPDGSVNYVLKNVIGSNEMIVQTDSANNYQLEITNPFASNFSDTKKTVFNIPINLKDNLLQRHIGMQIQHTYNIETNRKFVSANQQDTFAFYNKPTYSFNLDAFTRFNTIEEVIKEFVNDVQLRVKDNKPYFRVYDRGLLTLFDSDPLLLLDGVPIFDASKIVSFNPLKIQKIDVVANKYYLGASSYNGIISFKTYDGDLGGFQLDPSAVVLKFDGLQQQREFYHPKYETEAQQQSRVPDFRNQLCWMPNLKTDNTGKLATNFYTSDIAGKFVIVIQGITKTGKSGSAITTFQVK